MVQLTDSNIALLIDYENVGIDSMQNLVEQLSGLGRIIVKRAYADWSAQKKGQERLIELGVEAVHNYRGTRSGKNSCDIKLTIDAVELLHSAQVDTFVIVSSDSDFVPLVNHLRGSGKSVIGAGREAVTSTTMVKSCDRYIFLEIDEHTRNASKNTRYNRRPKKLPVSAKSEIIETGEDSLGELLERAVEATTDADGNALGTKLAQTMMRIDPSFSYKQLRHRSFREFLLSRPEVTVTLHEGTDFTVALNTEEHKPQKKLLNGTNSPTSPNVAPRIIRQSNDKHSQEDSNSNSNDLPMDWDVKVNDAWGDREKNQISGQSAAKEAAKVLGFQRLRDSIFPTLDKLLDASKLLKKNWSRNKNYVVKK